MLTFVAGGLSALLVNDTVWPGPDPAGGDGARSRPGDGPAAEVCSPRAGATNLGGVVSFSGSPQNMMIGRPLRRAPANAQYLILPCRSASPADGGQRLCTDAERFRGELPAGGAASARRRAPGLDRPRAWKGWPRSRSAAPSALRAGVSLTTGAAIAAAAAAGPAARASTRAARPGAAVDWRILLALRRPVRRGRGRAGHRRPR
ncbi:MAG: hypothetical protein HS111_23770 [Kofleriaceae bacterium]|nr:hypothetical protein [Kofleriaceae bacterium]